MEMVDLFHAENIPMHSIHILISRIIFPHSFKESPLPIMIYAQDSATNLKNAQINHRVSGYPSVEVSKNIVGPKRLLIGFSTTK